MLFCCFITVHSGYKLYHHLQMQSTYPKYFKFFLFLFFFTINLAIWCQHACVCAYKLTRDFSIFIICHWAKKKKATGSFRGSGLPSYIRAHFRDYSLPAFAIQSISFCHIPLGEAAMSSSPDTIRNTIISLLFQHAFEFKNNNQNQQSPKALWFKIFFKYVWF